jgi:hypothetical protein
LFLDDNLLSPTFKGPKYGKGSMIPVPKADPLISAYKINPFHEARMFEHICSYRCSSIYAPIQLPRTYNVCEQVSRDHNFCKLQSIDEVQAFTI